MAEHFFALSRRDQREALEYGRAETGRPVHLLEKDVWVVWVLQTLFESPLATHLTFKGGTSLSKAYKLIDRFSEDVDLTCDIRSLIPDLMGVEGEWPASRSQAEKWTKAIRHRLPVWMEQQVLPVIEEALRRDGLDARLVSGPDGDKLFLQYPALSKGTGYVAPVVTLEFGGRATGEPNQILPVTCDLAVSLAELSFPSVSARVMSVARTFWEKATAAHVFCAQRRIRGERYARHWHDLAAIARSAHFSAVMAEPEVAKIVARHKSWFFKEKRADGLVIDYFSATTGSLRIVPEGEAREALAKDYAAMLEDDLMMGGALAFEELLAVCADLEDKLNRVASQMDEGQPHG